MQRINHSVFDMHYHLVLVVKYRRKVLDDAISQFLKDMFVRIGKDYHVVVEEWEHDYDHIHVVFSARPATELSKLINSYKAASSRMVKKSSLVSPGNYGRVTSGRLGFTSVQLVEQT